MNWDGRMRCVAITCRGDRCGRRAVCALPITFAWDPVAGRGIGGPCAPMCRMHDYVWSMEASDRIEIVGGWLGRAWNPDAEVWTVMQTVYATRVGLCASPHWWSLRHETRFGVHREDYYDEAARGAEEKGTE